jgi:hypothetical protein
MHRSPRCIRGIWNGPRQRRPAAAYEGRLLHRSSFRKLFAAPSRGNRAIPCPSFRRLFATPSRRNRAIPCPSFRGRSRLHREWNPESACVSQAMKQIPGSACGRPGMTTLFGSVQATAHEARFLHRSSFRKSFAGHCDELRPSPCPSFRRLFATPSRRNRATTCPSFRGRSRFHREWNPESACVSQGMKQISGSACGRPGMTALFGSM